MVHPERLTLQQSELGLSGLEQARYSLPLLDRPLTIDCATVYLSDEQFYQLCVQNPELRIEQSQGGKVTFMAPVGGESGQREMFLGGELYLWNRQNQLGYVFSSSTIFQLPGGGKRSPDAAWVARERWEALSATEQERFPPLAPDFVMELRSRTDALGDLEAKMEEYRASGVRLGWLINPQDREVVIYRLGESGVERRSMPTVLAGDPVLPGFRLDLSLFS